MQEHTINKLPEDGYLVLPISMSRISNTQSPEDCYEILDFFKQKLGRFGLDVVILYTNGLYYNSSESALNIRRSTNQQMAAHKNKLQTLIEKGREFMPQAFHFLPWDYATLNGENFQGCFNLVKEFYADNLEFRDAVKEDLKDRAQSPEHIDFILEELVVTHLIRQKMLVLPKTLVKEDNFRIIIYPGSYLKSDKYLFESDVLPLNKKVGKRGYPYAAAHYDYTEKKLYDYSR